MCSKKEFPAWIDEHHGDKRHNFERTRQFLKTFVKILVKGDGKSHGRSILHQHCGSSASIYDFSPWG